MGLNLEAYGSLPTCTGSAYQQSNILIFDWSVAVESPRTVLTSIKSLSKDPSKFNLSPYSLKPGISYIVTVTARSTSLLYAMTSADVVVYVSPGAVIALIGGYAGDKNLHFILIFHIYDTYYK